MTAKLLLTVSEAAECLAIGRSKVYQLVTSGQLRSVSIGRARRIPFDALVRLISELESFDDPKQNPMERYPEPMA